VKYRKQKVETKR